MVSVNAFLHGVLSNGQFNALWYPTQRRHSKFSPNNWKTLTIKSKIHLYILIPFVVKEMGPN